MSDDTDECIARYKAKRKQKLRSDSITKDQLLNEAAYWYATTLFFLELVDEQSRFIKTIVEEEDRRASRKGTRMARVAIGNDKNNRHAAMAEVFRYWKRWKNEPHLYPTKADFDSDMQEKYSHLSLGGIKNARLRWEKAPYTYAVVNGRVTALPYPVISGSVIKAVAKKKQSN